jgi:CO/xanthine dehydrogenase Mo-binding subunit
MTCVGINGDTRLGRSNLTASGTRPVARFLRAFRAAAEEFTRQRLRYAARELDQSLLDRIAVSDPEAAQEIRRLFGISGGICHEKRHSGNERRDRADRGAIVRRRRSDGT